MMKAKVKASQTLAMLQKVRDMKAQGIDVVSFAAGEPDFPTPEVVQNAAIASLKKGNTYYVATPGIPALRKAIAKDYSERLGASWVKPEHVIVTAGAKQGLYLVLAALLERGDEVLIPKPYWVSYPDVVDAAQGVGVYISTKKSNGFFPTVEELDAAKTSKTKALIFSSPGNPSGTMISKDMLKATVEWCVKNKITLIYDELYERLVLGSQKHISALSLISENESEYVISVNAFSKTLAMTGWRLGYAVTAKENIDALSPLQGQMLTCLPGFLQEGAITGLEQVSTFLPGFISLYQSRMKALCEGLNQISNVSYLKPEGAFYVFVDMSQVIKERAFDGDKKLVEALLEEQKLVVVGGSSMGMHGWIRLSYSTSEAEIKRGVEHLK